MQDMIAQIVEMDRKAREITEKAQAEKVLSYTEVAKSREKIRNLYLENARKKIKQDEHIERVAAQEAWQKETANNQLLKANMRERYEANCSQWVSMLVKRVIEE